MRSSFADVDHLLRRSGFGGHASEIQALTAYEWSEVVDRVLDTSGAPDSYAGYPDMSDALPNWDRHVASIAFWMNSCATTPTPIVEKMALFWHGILCSSYAKVHDPAVMLDQMQIFRIHGLGNWGNLLHRISLHPAMLLYLDNDRNVVGSPNENFARELMELFTLGVGNYSERDVTESARAWTGYGVNDDKNAYVFHPEDHDGGQKTFMGVTRNWTGPDILSHILNGPTRTTAARYLARRMWSFFAYPDPSDALVQDLAATFLSANFEVRELLRAIFTRPEFRSDQARQGLVRSPIEFAVAGMRSTGLSAEEVHPEWFLPEMGQIPFRPPNVAGWKQNEYWISPSSAWARHSYAGYVRWIARKAGHLSNTRDLTEQQALEQALQLFRIYNASATTRRRLLDYIQAERSQGGGWNEQAGLLLLTQLTPEFQLA